MPVVSFGHYSYALALSTVGVTIMSAGLANIAVRELHNDRETNKATLAAILGARLLFALIGYATICLVSLTSDSELSVLATLIAGIAVFGRALEGPEAWFLSHLRSKKPAVAKALISTFFFLARLAAVLWIPNLWVLLVLFAVEAVVSGLSVVAVYRRDQLNPGLGMPRRRDVRKLLAQSWPLIISGLANQVNLKADVVLIGALLGAESVAVYSAAARLSELAYFLPLAFMNSTFPVLLSIRKSFGSTSRQYLDRLQRSYDQAFWAGVLIALVVAVSGTVIIRTAFGAAYDESVTILWVHVIAMPFVFMQAVYGKWIVAEGLLWNSVLRNSVGALVNIIATVLLLPHFGLLGAAWATVLSYISAAYLSTFLNRSSRVAGRQMTLALVAPVRLVARVGRRTRPGL
jgi:O-antigen/teichoic acid export membrane protein